MAGIYRGQLNTRYEKNSGISMTHKEDYVPLEKILSRVTKGEYIPRQNISYEFNNSEEAINNIDVQDLSRISDLAEMTEKIENAKEITANLINESKNRKNVVKNEKTDVLENSTQEAENKTSQTKSPSQQEAG